MTGTPIIQPRKYLPMTNIPIREPRMFSTLSPRQVPLAEPAGERTVITLIVPFERGGYRAVSRIKDQFRAS